MTRPPRPILTPLALACLLLPFGLPFGRAQELPPVVTLPVALGRGVGLSAEVIAARAELEAAERAFQRTTADPFALRLPKVQAEHALENARAALEGARLSARAETQDAYFGALEADDAVRLAELRRATLQTTLEATQIRFEAGAATGVDLEGARNDLREAERALTESRSRRALAYSGLASRLGGTAETLSLREPEPLPTLPDLPSVLMRLSGHTELQRAEQAVEEAHIYLAGVDNAFSAPVEVEAAQAAYASARSSLEALRRSLAFALRASHNAALVAQGALETAEGSLATAREALAAQRLRFEAGSISELELAQAELEVATSEAQVRSARHDVARASLALEGAVRGGGFGAISSPGGAALGDPPAPLEPPE